MNRFIAGISVVCVCGLIGAGCGAPEKPAPTGPLALVIFSQANSSDPWRRMYDQQMAAGAKQHATDFKFEEMDATGDAKKQVDQIKMAIAKKPKVLMVSPVSEAVLPAVGEAHDAGIFVFLLDMADKDTKADSWFGANTVATGSDMATFYGRGMHLKGTVLVIPGPTTSRVAKERKLGVDQGLKRFGKQITEVVADDCGGDESKAKAFVAEYLKTKKPVDAIFAINDDMALGAAQAVKDANAKVPYIFGIGGCEKKVFDALNSGAIFATFSTPPGGPVALERIPDLLNGTKLPKTSYVPDDEIRKDTMKNYLAQHPILGD